MKNKTLILAVSAVLLVIAVTIAVLISQNSNSTADGGLKSLSEDTEQKTPISAEDADIQIRQNLSAEEFSSNAEVANWIATCNSTERDGIGTYALWYAAPTDDGKVVYSYLILRTGLESSSDIDVTLEEGTEKNYITATVTSNNAPLGEGYQLTYFTLTVNNSSSTALSVVVDGNSAGLIRTAARAPITITKNN